MIVFCERQCCQTDIFLEVCGGYLKARCVIFSDEIAKLLAPLFVSHLQRYATIRFASIINALTAMTFVC